MTRGYVFGAVLLGAAFLLAGCFPEPAATVTGVTDGGAGHVIVAVRTSDSTGTQFWDVGDDGTLIGPVGPIAAPVAAPVTEACGTVDCYRVVPGSLAVQVSADRGATYTTAWQVTGRNYRALAASYHYATASTSLVVHGDVVFVANGADGVLYRDAAGAWHRLGIPMGGEGSYWQRPHRLESEPAPFDLTWYMVAFASLVPLAVAVVARRFFRAPMWPALTVAGIAAGLAWSIMQINDVGMFPAVFYWALFLTPTIALGGLAVLVLFARYGRRVRPEPVRPGPSGSGT